MKRLPSQNSRRAMPVLPTYYYHENFCELLDFVARTYDHALRAADIDFLAAFRSLPRDAQCLYVRLSQRKGIVFNTEKLDYGEIGDLGRALDQLKAAGFARYLEPHHYLAWLNVMTKPEIVQLWEDYGPDLPIRKSAKKAVLIDRVAAELPFSRLPHLPQYIVQGFTDNLRYLYFLYFGKIEINMQNFTMRDLGLIRLPESKGDYEARFSSREQAESAYFYASGLQTFKHGSEAALARLIDRADVWPEAVCDMSLKLRDRLLKKIGGLSEQLGDVETALKFYSRTDTPHCNERAVRLRYARGETDWVKARLEEMIEDPATDADLDFAEDFYARKFEKKRTSRVTDMLRGAASIVLDEAFKNTPESAAMRYFSQSGYDAYYAENGLWKSLFGLTFWELLYGEDAAALHSSFDMLPQSLKNGSFYAENAAAIERRLCAFDKPQRNILDLLKTYSKNFGHRNGVFMWHNGIMDRLSALLQNAPKDAAAHVLRIMAQDYPRMRDGFPDLMLVKDGALRFVEIKAEGDVIRRNQFTRIRQMREAGLSTDIVKINWQVDPDQTYVVVDVETTGGRPPHHRVTEIGAVKVRGGKVIDEWQSLINPERHIPAHITGLTGISNEMVSTAPLFETVADDFMAFLEGAIFAAHNVNFDYGFIKSEFARTGQRLSMPKLCTCSGMRQYYKGHKSYSLKNLCRAFQIDLETHHRALCDARAAAELLFLINDKRLDG